MHETFTKMNGITIISILVVLFSGVSHGFYSSRLHTNLHPLQNVQRDLSLSCSCEDLSTLVAIVRALEERECGSTGPSGGICNADELIMNLVNALVELTTQALSHNCHQNGNYYPGKEGYGHYYPNYNGGYGYSHSDGGLNLDLLNPNRKDNVLDLDLARQHLLGVGLGGGGESSYGSSGYYNSHGRSGNDEGLVNVDLLNPYKKNNVADVDVGKQHLVGVGLGGGGSAPSQTSSYNGKESNSGEGLLNVDLLNPNKEDNVADVDLGKQTVLGIGLGDRKEGAGHD